MEDKFIKTPTGITINLKYVLYIEHGADGKYPGLFVVGFQMTNGQGLGVRFDNEEDARKYHAEVDELLGTITYLHESPALSPKQLQSYDKQRS